MLNFNHICITLLPYKLSQLPCQAGILISILKMSKLRSELFYPRSHNCQWKPKHSDSDLTDSQVCTPDYINQRGNVVQSGASVSSSERFKDQCASHTRKAAHLGILRLKQWPPNFCNLYLYQ